MKNPIKPKRAKVSNISLTLKKEHVYDCHMHIFDYKCVPDNFLPKLVQTIAKNHLKAFVKIMKKLARRFEDSHLERFATMAKIFDKSQQQILDAILRYVNQDLGLTNMHYAVLMMDMQYMDRGHCERTLREQLIQLCDIRALPVYKDRIYPFLAIDPRRELLETERDLQLMPLFEDFEDEIFGLKLYCGLGYFPFGLGSQLDKLEADLNDSSVKFTKMERTAAKEILEEAKIMDKVYKKAIERNLPIVTHCGIYNAVYTNMPRRKLVTKIKLGIKYFWDDRTFEEVGLIFKDKHFYRHFMRTHFWKKKRYLANFFFLPQNYRCALENYPGLKLCFGHFGGQDEWDRHFGHPPAKGREKFFKPKQDWLLTIIELMREHENVYADLAYNMCFSQLYANLNDLLVNTGIEDRILYATDFFFNENLVSAFQYNQNIINRMNDPLFLKIARVNPRKFLQHKEWTPP